MEYKFLGRTGVKVSQLCFGTMSFGDEADEEMSFKLYHRCRDAGINFFDCANMYSTGRAETILGNLISGHRNEIVLTTKAYFPMSSDPNAQGASRYHLFNSVEDSLRRLNTDRIDIFFIHRFDDYTALEETLRALDDLVSMGKILYPAASNFAAWQVMKALGISDVHGWARFTVLQPMYNLVKRIAEVEILPMAESEELAVIPYSPLGGGLLSGKYASGARPESGRLIRSVRYSTRYGEEWMHSTADNLKTMAEEIGVHPASLAIAWVAANPGVTAPIIGARNLDHLDAALKSLDIDMTDDLYERVSALSPTPPPATDRNEERLVNTYGPR